MGTHSGWIDSGYDLPASASAGTWQHLVATFDGTYTKFYIDGTFVGQLTGSKGNNIRDIGSYSGNDQRFAQYLDDFRVYGIVLSASEASSIYNNGNGDLSYAHGSGPAHLVGTSPFNSGGSRYKGGTLTGSGLVAGNAPGGGSYGGSGGRPEGSGGTDSQGAHSISGGVYGTLAMDAFLGGSGGGSGQNRAGGAGGGAIKIVASGTLTINGNIIANGGIGGTAPVNDASLAGGSGSGGAVYLKGNNLVINAGVSISADGGPGASFVSNGGNSEATDGGGVGPAAGGGGRVFIEGTSTFVNHHSVTNENITANSGGKASPAGLFSKDVDGLTLWLDAADSSSITHSSNAVSQWSDKSGNGNHATQSTSANQPVLTSKQLTDQALQQKRYNLMEQMTDSA